MERVIVTGGAGFIGSAVVRQLLDETDASVINVDKLTYAASLASIESVTSHPRYAFEQVDICDTAALRMVFAEHRPDAVLHLAAESHVDRSIDGPEQFVQTNIVGTFRLLTETLRYWQSLGTEARARFRFHHVSTDEVYGSLGAVGLFTETTAYDPRSPYSASKAASDHLVRAWQETYGLPTLITNCSNNYGPYQFPEKLIPLTILKALAREPIPVYGRGDNIRDWLHVEDHARALQLVLESGRVGNAYNVGARSERKNIDVVRLICGILDKLRPASAPHEQLIRFVKDRPGHDQRYGIDPSKIERELGWRPLQSFESGLRKTVEWYLGHEEWWRPILNGSYDGERLGVAGVSGVKELAAAGSPGAA